MLFKGLFINNKKANDSIYESGLMVYNCLKSSDKYQIDYIETDAENRLISSEYDFYFFNYHPATMHWMDTSKLKRLPGIIITMVLEVSPGNPFVLCPRNHFDAYCVLDPTVISDNIKVFAFPRPLEKTYIKEYIPNDIPTIGTFGFATKGKGFQHVVDAVNKEFEQAIVKINIPFGSFVPDAQSYATFLGNLCKEKAKPGISVVVTHTYMSKPELINWCAQNTLNCFLYDRNMPGLSATTDQAIVAERPLAVSNNDTFRHILTYLDPYPNFSLKQSIETSLSSVLAMKKDWSQENFLIRFESMLDILIAKTKSCRSMSEFIQIPLLADNTLEQIKKNIGKYKGIFSIRKIKKIPLLKTLFKDEELI